METKTEEDEEVSGSGRTTSNVYVASVEALRSMRFIAFGICMYKKSLMMLTATWNQIIRHGEIIGGWKKGRIFGI